MLHSCWILGRRGRGGLRGRGCCGDQRGRGGVVLRFHGIDDEARAEVVLAQVGQAHDGAGHHAEMHVGKVDGLQAHH